MTQDFPSFFLFSFNNIKCTTQVHLNRVSFKFIIGTLCYFFFLSFYVIKKRKLEFIFYFYNYILVQPLLVLVIAQSFKRTTSSNSAFIVLIYSFFKEETSVCYYNLKFKFLRQGERKKINFYF